MGVYWPTGRDLMSFLKSFIFIAIVGISLTVQASSVQIEDSEKYLGYCSNYGDGVSFSFSSCINRNFARVGQQLGRVMRHCFNSSQGVSFSFTSCINSNFRSIESSSNGSLFLRYCSNFNRDRLDFSYVSCVNSNFSAISRTTLP